MYFAKIKFPQEPDSNSIWNLILTSVDDVHEYEKLIEPQSDRDMLRMWGHLKDGADVAHSTNIDSFVSQLMGIEILKSMYADLDTDDNFIIKPEIAFANTKRALNDVHREMAKIIGVGGNPVRVSRLGGYSPYTDMYEEVDTKPFSNNAFYDWFYNKNDEEVPSSELIKINKTTIIIENDLYPPRKLREHVKKVDDYELINNFDIRTKYYDKENFIDMFSDWVDSGLENVYIETTMTNKAGIKKSSQPHQQQFFTLVKIFMVVLEEKNKTINLFLRCPDMYYNRVEKFINKNINLIFLEL